MPSIATRGKDIVGDAIGSYMPPDDGPVDQSDLGHNDGWIRFGRDGYEVSVIYKHTAEVMGRRKA